MYYTGKGIKKNYKKAKKCFKSAANQDNEFIYLFKRIHYKFNSKYELGLTNCISFSCDNEYFLGEIESARYNLGVIYYKGKGVKKNYKKGYKWFLKADNTFTLNNYTKFTLGLINYVGIGVEQNYKEAFKWFNKILGLNSRDYILGQLYLHGIGVKKDYKNASKYFKYFPFFKLEATDLFFSGNIYYFGLDLDFLQNEFRYIYAYSLYKKAAEKGNAHAKYMLGLIYQEGKNERIGKDEKKALECFKSAYEKEDDDNKLTQITS
jgi:TPR repeat protein